MLHALFAVRLTSLTPVQPYGRASYPEIRWLVPCRAGILVACAVGATDSVMAAASVK